MLARRLVRVALVAAPLAIALWPAPVAAQTGRCGPLAASSAPAMTVADGPALARAIERAATGSTILLRDGTYRLNGPIIVRTPGLTIRSASGNAERVVIDGEYRVSEPFMVEAPDTTIAHVTITRAVDHLVHIVPRPRNTIRNVRLYGLRLIDAGEQFVKANPDAGRTAFVDESIVECSEFQLTDTGRTKVETLGGTQCYTGGIDVHGGRGWIVRQNRFEGLFCRTGFMAEHAVHFWMESGDTMVENNLIVNCARGIGFGLGPSNPATRRWDSVQGAAGYVGHYGGTIRNNVIVADIPEYDTGIGLEQARGVRVLHNTVFAAPSASKAFSSIDARFANTTAEIHNNLVNNITRREAPVVTASHNLEQVTTRDFAGAVRMDFHLRAGSKAIDAGIALADAGVDMDGETRGEKPDVGADERSSGIRGEPRNSGTSEPRNLPLRHRKTRHRDFGVVSETQTVDAVG